jgi:hypothetical protein
MISTSLRSVSPRKVVPRAVVAAESTMPHSRATAAAVVAAGQDRAHDGGLSTGKCVQPSTSVSGASATANSGSR